MNKYISLVFIVFLSSSVSLYALDKNGNFESKEEQANYIAAILKNMVIEINNQTPIMLDKETQMTHVLALNKTINFNYKLVNVSSVEANSEEIKKLALFNMNDIACKDQATKALIDLGVTYVYIYFGNDNRLITRASLSKYKCKTE